MKIFPPDWNTVVFQIALFVALWFALSRLWFGPALRVLRERRARSEGAIAEARSIKAEAERLRAEHAAALDESQAAARREMQELVRGAEEEQKRLIAAAHDDAQRTLGEVRSRIAEEVAQARRDLHASAGEIAHIVAGKVLGRQP